MDSDRIGFFNPANWLASRGKSEGLAIEITGLRAKTRTPSEERLLQQLLRIQNGEEVDFTEPPSVKPDNQEARRQAILGMLAKGPMYCKYVAQQLHVSAPTALRDLQHEWFRQDASNDNRWMLTAAGYAALEATK